jgi:hypothetical protein
MGRRPNSDGGEIRFSTSKAQQELLEHLAAKSQRGKTPNAVAQYLLTEALIKIDEKRD